MQSETEIILETDADEPTAVARKVLPFSFAKRHGVLIREFGADSADVVYLQIA